jgi:hypothetical protein
VRPNYIGLQVCISSTSAVSHTPEKALLWHFLWESCSKRRSSEWLAMEMLSWTRRFIYRRYRVWDYRAPIVLVSGVLWWTWRRYFSLSKASAAVEVNSSVFWLITWHTGPILEGKAWPLKMGPIRSPETSVRNQPTLRRIPDDIIQVKHSGSLRALIL